MSLYVTGMFWNSAEFTNSFRGQHIELFFCLPKKRKKKKKCVNNNSVLYWLQKQQRWQMLQFSSMLLHQENILKYAVIAVCENDLVALFICPPSTSSWFAVSNRVIHMLRLHTCFGALLDQGLIDTLIDRLSGETED